MKPNPFSSYITVDMSSVISNPLFQLGALIADTMINGSKDKAAVVVDVLGTALASGDAYHALHIFQKHGHLIPEEEVAIATILVRQCNLQVEYDLKVEEMSKRLTAAQDRVEADSVGLPKFGHSMADRIKALRQKGTLDDPNGNIDAVAKVLDEMESAGNKKLLH